MIKALIFDMDGVLVDSEPYHLLAYQKLLEQYGINYSENDNQEFLGRTDGVIAEILIERYAMDITPESLIGGKEEILTGLLKKHAQPRPGVKAVLAEAQSLNIPMAVASSAVLATIELIVNLLNIREYFHNLSSGQEVAQGKPAPDVFLLAAQRLQVPPAQCLVIEDTFNGVKAAKAAGMKCVAIPCEATKHQDHSAADQQLPSLQNLDLRFWLN